MNYTRTRYNNDVWQIMSSDGKFVAQLLRHTNGVWAAFDINDHRIAGTTGLTLGDAFRKWKEKQ